MPEYIERTEELVLAMNAGARASRTQGAITALFHQRCVLGGLTGNPYCWLPKCCGK